MSSNSQCFKDSYDSDTLSIEYQEAEPYAHVVLENLLTPKKALQASEAFLDSDLSSWKPYHNPLEERYICIDMSNIYANFHLNFLVQYN